MIIKPSVMQVATAKKAMEVRDIIKAPTTTTTSEVKPTGYWPAAEKVKAELEAVLDPTQPKRLDPSTFGIGYWVEEVNASRANYLLEKSKGVINNRRLNPDRVALYKGMMLDNKWPMNGEGISLDREGNLINGQHRLHAVVECDKERPGFSIPLMFVNGVQKEAMATIDSGYARTVAQSAKIIGVETNKHQLSIAKYLYFTYGSNIRDMKKVSRVKIIETYEKYSEEIAFAAQRFGTSNISYAPYRSIIVRALVLGEDKAVLARFMEVVDTGLYSGDEESVAILLRGHILNRRHHREFATSQDLYLRSMWALDKFLKKKPYKTLGRASSQLYPIPELDEFL